MDTCIFFILLSLKLAQAQIEFSGLCYHEELFNLELEIIADPSGFQLITLKTFVVSVKWFIIDVLSSKIFISVQMCRHVSFNLPSDPPAIKTVTFEQNSQVQLLYPSQIQFGIYKRVSKLLFHHLGQKGFCAI